jgi:hypothetical protein
LVTSDSKPSGHASSAPSAWVTQQLIRQLLVNQRRPHSLTVVGLTRTIAVSVVACPFRKPNLLRLIVRPRHLHGR